MEFNHIPVLRKETIEGLNVIPNGIYVDGTLGGAGHSIKILEKLSRDGLLIGIDRDREALLHAKEELKEYTNVKYIHENHDNIKQILQELNIEKVDGILLDLGVSSYQIDEDTRGFSYTKDALLDMRMDNTQKITAKDVVNSYTEEKLKHIFYEYGEEKFTKQIVRAICLARKTKEIETTKELVELITKAVPAKQGGHPAKRVFQAIRIEVNNEIEPLYNTIIDSISCLKEKGRLCVITFHSLEDKFVKRAFLDSIGTCTCPKNLPYCVCNNKKEGIIITRKPIIPTKEEIEKNPRSSSSKLRIFEKI